MLDLLVYQFSPLGGAVRPARCLIAGRSCLAGDVLANTSWRKLRRVIWCIADAAGYIW